MSDEQEMLEFFKEKNCIEIIMAQCKLKHAWNAYIEGTQTGSGKPGG